METCEQKCQEGSKDGGVGEQADVHTGPGVILAQFGAVIRFVDAACKLRSCSGGKREI